VKRSMLTVIALLVLAGILWAAGPRTADAQSVMTANVGEYEASLRSVSTSRSRSSCATRMVARRSIHSMRGCDR
jgi:hypothetical protein